MKHANQVCMITGGGRGIGAAIARYLAARGAKLALVDVGAEALAKTAAELEQSGAQVHTGMVDITRAGDVQSFVQQAVEKFGSLDVLVNNAGISIDNLFLRFSVADFEKVMAVNLTGSFLCAQAAAKVMLKNRRGRIINISSVIGAMGNPGQIAYASSKAALMGLTKTLARELASRNITVNAVAPGFIQTPMTDALSEEVRQEYLRRIPLGRFGTAEDVAALVSFLASDEAAYITGQVLHLNGGLLMP